MQHIAGNLFAKTGISHWRKTVAAKSPCDLSKSVRIFHVYLGRNQSDKSRGIKLSLITSVNSEYFLKATFVNLTDFVMYFP